MNISALIGRGGTLERPIDRADLVLTLYGAGSDSERLDRLLTDAFIWARLRLSVDPATFAEVAMRRAAAEIGDAVDELDFGGFNPCPRLWDLVEEDHR